MDIEKAVSEMSLEEKASMCSGRDYWHTKAIERLGIPSMMMCDATHGLRKQIGEGDHLGINESISAVCFPTAVAMASSFDCELMRELGETMAAECKAEDVGMLLGPGLNIKRSPLCGRNFEYLSEDPYITAEMGVAYIKGLQQNGVAACVKHFAANNQETRRMVSDSRLDERTLHEIYLPAFEAAVKEGKVQAVMSAYNLLNGEYCSENKALLTGILREKWGFDGIVVTDWGGVKDRVKGLDAGLDLEMPGGPGNQDAKIVQAVKEGTLPEAVLDAAVERNLRLLSAYMESGMPKGGKKGIDLKKDHALSAHFAKECAVLMKNEGSILPLSKTAGIAFIGAFAKSPRYQGAGSSHVNTPLVTNALEAARAMGIPVEYAQGYRLGKPETDEDASLLSEAVAAAQRADTAVLFVGLPDAYETEGVDRVTLAPPDNQTALIQAVTSSQPNTVVVLHGGAVVEMPWLDSVPGILNMHLAGDNVGTAEVSLLFGETNPSGKLAETYPVKLQDNPSYLNFPGENSVVEYREGVFVGYRYYDKREMQVLFPFGHGLSYTEFEYSNLSLGKDSILDTETLQVQCKIKNFGKVAGKEAVQLYVRPQHGNVNRPVRELKGFAKVHLVAGEEKTVTFTLNKRSFAYYEPRIEDWFVETGSFSIEIGSSSRDIRLVGTVYVQGTTEIPQTFSRYSTIGQLMQTEMGAPVIQQIMNSEQNTEHDISHLGESSAERVQASVPDMPLASLVTFGRMTEEQLDSLLERLNSAKR